MSAFAPDGTEMCVVQECNWSAEPFTTSFVIRRPGQHWAWFYYDHEDLYWGSGEVKLDPRTKTAVFHRGQAPAITFSWETESYFLHRRGSQVTGAQKTLPATWSPEQSVYSHKL